MQTRSRRAFARRAIGATALASLLATTLACGLGDKQARADVVIDSVERAIGAGSATGTFSVATHIVELPPSLVALGRDGGAGGAAIGTDVSALTADIELDLERRQASVARPGEAPFQLFEDLVQFGRRHAASERDARPWLRVDLESLDEGGGGLQPQNDHLALAAFALNPSLLLELMAGPLSGSVEPGSVEDIDGVDTRRYEANFDIEKVMRKTRRSHFPEHRRRAVEDLFETLAVSGVTHPGQIWIDDEGMPRRAVLRLRQQPQRGLRIDLVLQLDLTSFGAPVELTMPPPEERLETGSVVQFLRAVVQLSEQPAPTGDAPMSDPNADEAATP